MCWRDHVVLAGALWIGVDVLSPAAHAAAAAAAAAASTATTTQADHHQRLAHAP